MNLRLKLFFIKVCFFVIAIPCNSFSQTSNEIVIKFNYSYLNFDVINNKKILSIPFEEVLNDRAKGKLKELELIYPGISNININKIFPFLTTFDTVSISRQGQKVTIPPFWASFSMKVPSKINTQKLINDLDNFSPLIEYCHFNYFAYPANAPNDSLYIKQVSLNGSTSLPNAGINIENAWGIETGKSFIKVGIHDSGIDTTHPDLNVVFGGAYYTEDSSIMYGWGEDTYGHGTPVAGIIGAKRNNNTGIAGIAGGDTTSGSGCSMFDFRLNFYGQSLSSYICASVVDAARSVDSYWDYTDGYYDETNTYFDHTPGFGIHIGNHSYIIKTNSPIPQDPTDTGSGDDDDDDDDDDDGNGGNGNGGNGNGGNGNGGNGNGGNGGSKSILKDISDSTIVNESVCNLCREAYLFSLKNGVINVVSRGNSGHFSPSTDPTLINYTYPQSFPDNWIISVGASGYDGVTVQNGLNQSQFEAQSDYWSMYGGNMDIIAPGSDSIVFTTSMVNSVTQSYPYEKFNGTSAAAPHVSGVVALLLSHFNKDCYSNGNLSVEDVEYILERSATNLYGTGYDDTTGWGRLDAYKALQMIENPTKQIVHPDSLISSNIISIDTIALSYRNAFVADGWGPISNSMPLENNRYYQVERVLVENTYSFTEYMSLNTSLIDVWLRQSASNSLGYYEDTISYPAGPITQYEFDEFDMMPYEELISIDSTLFKVKIRGYYYHFIARYIDEYDIIIDPLFPINTWLPVNPLIDPVKMYFSLYIKDSTLTSFYDFPCDSLNPLYDDDLGIENNYINNSNFQIFPNPSNESITIKGVDNQIITKIEIFDLNGKLIYSMNPNTKQVKIEISNYQQGTYFVKCHDEKFSKTLKLIKL